MRVDHDLQWMKSYIKKALAAFPKLKAVKYIHCKKTTLKLDIEQPAAAYYDGGSRKGEIYLALYREKEQTKCKYNKVELLEFLAHEFCHVFFEGHVPHEEFLVTEAAILKAMTDGEEVKED